MDELIIYIACGVFVAIAFALVYSWLEPRLGSKGDEDGEEVWYEGEDAWYENGQKKREVTSLRFDHVTEWHASGQKESEGHYKEGERDGLWTWWDEHGNITEQVTYRNGGEVK